MAEVTVLIVLGAFILICFVATPFIYKKIEDDRVKNLEKIQDKYKSMLDDMQAYEELLEDMGEVTKKIEGLYKSVAEIKEYMNKIPVKEEKDNGNTVQ